MFTSMRDENYAPVSVVIPCFRCTRTVGRAIDSVVRQTLIPRQIILIDDASGDDTLSFLKECEKKYAPFILIIELRLNQGAGCARNIGWSMASQPYIAFLDADDSWHPKKIEVQLAYMDAHPEVALSGHGFKLLAGEDNYPNWELNNLSAKNVSKKSLLLSNKFVTPSVMVRRDIPQRFRPDQRHMEDHMLWLDILFGGGRVMLISAALAALHKPQFGVSGLSSQMWKMEQGDLRNYKRLYSLGHITMSSWLILSVFSCVKFIRRLIINRVSSLFFLLRG